MTHPVYSEQHLSTLKRPQLWVICDQLGLPKYAASAKCIEAILNAQPEKVADISESADNSGDNESATTNSQAADAHKQQPFTCATCPKFKSHDDGTSNGWCSLFDHFAVAHHKETSDCVNTLADEQNDVDNSDDKTNITLGNQAEQTSPVQPFTREERAAAIEVVEVHDNNFVTRNPENNNHYVVRPNHPVANERCECADAHFRGAKCKHQIAVGKFIEQNSEHTLNSLEAALTQQQEQSFSLIKLEDALSGDRIIVQGVEVEVQYSRPAWKEGDIEVIVKQLDGANYGITHRADMMVQKRIPPAPPKTVKKRIDHVVVGDGVYKDWQNWQIYDIQVEQYKTRQFRNSFYTSRFILHLVDASLVKQGIWRKDVMTVFAQDSLEVLDF